ncbi:MAG: VOC family protein [Opitutales bacterium]
MKLTTTTRSLYAACAWLILVSLPLPGAEPLGFTVPPLQSPSSNERHPGKFIWGDLFAEYPLQLGKFYSQVFGWNLRRFGTDKTAYWLLSNDDQPVAGIVRHSLKEKKPGSLQARWVGYISVEDVEEAAERVVEEGGKLLLPPREVPDRGSLAIATDSEGTIIGFMHSDSGDPPDRLAAVGEWVWVQLFSADPAKAVSFYQDVFELEGEPDTRTESEDDFLLVSGGHSRASLVPFQRNSRRGGWLGFVRVTDVEETIQAATDIGGRVIMDPETVEETGRMAVIADPYGGVVGLFQFSE